MGIEIWHMLPLLSSSIDFIPGPRGLTIGRQLTSSVLIGWRPHEAGGVTQSEVQSYHVYVDGEFKTSVKGTERTKALVEGVSASSVSASCLSDHLSCYLFCSLFFSGSVYLFFFVIHLLCVSIFLYFRSLTTCTI